MTDKRLAYLGVRLHTPGGSALRHPYRVKKPGLVLNSCKMPVCEVKKIRYSEFSGFVLELSDTKSYVEG